MCVCMGPARKGPANVSWRGVLRIVPLKHGPFGVRVKKNEQRGNESSWFSGDRQTARQTD